MFDRINDFPEQEYRGRETDELTPEFYLDREGGDWLPWTEGKVRITRGTRRILGAGFTVIHAVKMADGSVWDCVNGWRNTVPPRRETDDSPGKASYRPRRRI